MPNDEYDDDFPSPSEDEDPAAADGPAAYILTHESTGMFYIGSSGNIKVRLAAHKNTLARGVHDSTTLQELYAHDDEMSVEILKTRNKEEALNLEQQLLDEHYGQPFCINKAKDARVSGKGIYPTDEVREKQSKAHLGQKRSPESINKQRQAMLEHWSDVDVKAARSASQKESWAGNSTRRDAQSQKMTERWKTNDFKSVRKAAMEKYWDNNPEKRDERRAKMTGRVFSQESLERMKKAQELRGSQVSINGVIYPTLSEAGRQLNISQATVSYRVNSNDEKFKDWFKI